MLTTSKNVYKTLINLWNKQVEDYKGPDWTHLTAEAKQKHEKEFLYEHPWLIYTATKLWRKSTTGANWLQGHSTWRTQEQKIKTSQGTTEDNQHQLNRINNKKKKKVILMVSGHPLHQNRLVVAKDPFQLQGPWAKNIGQPKQQCDLAS